MQTYKTSLNSQLACKASGTARNTATLQRWGFILHLRQNMLASGFGFPSPTGRCEPSLPLETPHCAGRTGGRSISSLIR